MTHLLEDAKVELQADLIRLWPELPQESSQGNIAPLKQTLRNMADGEPLAQPLCPYDQRFQ